MKKIKIPIRLAESMVIVGVSLGFGAIYWIIDTILYLITTGVSSPADSVFHVSPRELGQRLIVFFFFLIFGSHVQYNAKKRREQEQVLQETQERYRSLVETSTDAIISVNEAMQVIQWNRAASDLFGYSKELMMGKSIEVLMPEKFRKGHGEGVRRFLETGESQFVGRTVEFEGQRKDGTIRPIEISLSADKNNGSWTFTSIIRETTERRQALEALRESEERYRNLFEDTKDAVMIWTAEGKILGVNQATLEIFGYNVEEMIGADISDLFQQNEDRALFHRKLLDEGSVRGYEILLRRKNGLPLDCLLTATVRRGKDGGVLGYQGIVRDVTDFKRNENELKQTLETLRKSIGGITQAMSSVVENRDPYTAGHQKRVAELSQAIAQEMGLPQDQIDAVRMAATLHDIGKIAVPSEILTSPGRLSQKAFDLIKDHPKTGYDILKEIEFPWPIAEMILQHHERLDGSGYPHGLSGDAIMLEARIITVADVVEAMASHRPYRPSLGIEAAMQEMDKHNGTRYDPSVVDACRRLFREKHDRIAHIFTSYL
jgi:PAS domain S-box-containing protein/putative nucleotidyltransferase with HDIG domain